MVTAKETCFPAGTSKRKSKLPTAESVSLRNSYWHCSSNHLTAAVDVIDVLQTKVRMVSAPNLLGAANLHTGQLSEASEQPQLANCALVFKQPVYLWHNYSTSSDRPDSAAAYAYARMEFPGKRVIYSLLLATLFLPGIMFLVPNFLTVASLGLLNSYLGVILPSLSGVFGLFFMRQFFESIPKELEEAAHIDGATRLQTFLYVALPLSKPALATLGDYHLFRFLE
jgi:hypothetical protein